jgi:hypothetical protein
MLSGFPCLFLSVRLRDSFFLLTTIDDRETALQRTTVPIEKLMVHPANNVGANQGWGHASP